MKSLNELKVTLNHDSFDLDHETKMVQLRILSSILEVIDDKGLTQSDVEELTGLKQPFLSALFNNRKRLNMEHIALFQNALEIVLQPPSYLSKEGHRNMFYKESDYENVQGQIFEIVCNHSKLNILNSYTSSRKKGPYVGTTKISQWKLSDSDDDKIISHYPRKQCAY